MPTHNERFKTFYDKAVAGTITFEELTSGYLTDFQKRTLFDIVNAGTSSVVTPVVSLPHAVTNGDDTDYASAPAEAYEYAIQPDDGVTLLVDGFTVEGLWVDTAEAGRTMSIPVVTGGTFKWRVKV